VPITDYAAAQDELLAAYDHLTLATIACNLQTMKTARRLVLDCYWQINELRTNPPGHSRR